MKAYLRVITETFFGCGKGASDLMKVRLGGIFDSSTEVYTNLNFVIAS
jgi:hypothetical protein